MQAKGRRGSFLPGTTQTAVLGAVAVGTTAPIPAATLISLESPRSGTVTIATSPVRDK
jgi:hypothetical protein